MMIELSQFFPNVKGLVLFAIYVLLFVGQGVLVKATHRKGEGYAYNTTSVVLLTETLKFFLAHICYLRNNSLSSLWYGVRNNLKILCLYLVPSFLYCIYNNLAFVNLSHFDPTSYFILLQLRVLFTGVIFQIVFSKKLTKIQWFSLVLLTVSCMIQQLDWDLLKSTFLDDLDGGENSKISAFFSIYLFFIIVQTFCSCFAGVYNEHLLKETGVNVNIFIQNIFMYLDSIFWNLLVIGFQGNLTSTFSAEELRPILKPLVLIMIFNNSVLGITTSLFLKSLNSILKTFASAIELVFTAVLSWIIFGIEVKLNTVIAIVLLCYSLYMYAQSPANNSKKNTEKNQKEFEVV